MLPIYITYNITYEDYIFIYITYNITYEDYIYIYISPIKLPIKIIFIGLSL